MTAIKIVYAGDGTSSSLRTLSLYLLQLQHFCNDVAQCSNDRAPVQSHEAEAQLMCIALLSTKVARST